MADDLPNFKLSRKYEALHAGQRFGRLIVRQRISDDLKTKSINLRKRVRVQCDCGSRPETIPAYYLFRMPNPKTSCGKCEDRKSLKTIHANVYSCWYMMRTRCNDPRHVAYESYGGRGIKVCAEWDNSETGFEEFLRHIGARPSMKYSVDRIDNDGGYYPGNVKWSTAKEQANNKRPRKHNHKAQPQ